MIPAATAALTEIADPPESARAVGLRYVSAEMPGITREKSGAGFRYRYPTGELVKEEPVLKRIHSLVIPPAWTDVWICPDPAGHLQATGRDARGRRQSRYHPRWREIRDATKYARMLAFGRALPRIRKRVAADLRQPALSRSKVLATVVRLLEVSLIRVGNDEYVRENDSFGLTTMRAKHVKVRGSTLRFHFRGKAGKWHEVDIEDARLARTVRNCQELPGQELFQYVSEEGERKRVSSEDVNEYLQEIAGEEFSAKDFRTWAGSVLAAMALSQFREFDSQAQAKKNVVQAIEAVAQRLGNTPTICRKCYVHPELLDSYLDGTLVESLKQRAERRIAKRLNRLRPEEAAVLAFLQQRLATEKTRLADNLQRSLRRVQKERGRLRPRVRSNAKSRTKASALLSAPEQRPRSAPVRRR